MLFQTVSSLKRKTQETQGKGAHCLEKPLKAFSLMGRVTLLSIPCFTAPVELPWCYCSHQWKKKRDTWKAVNVSEKSTFLSTARKMKGRAFAAHPLCAQFPYWGTLGETRQFCSPGRFYLCHKYSPLMLCFTLGLLQLSALKNALITSLGDKPTLWDKQTVSPVLFLHYSSSD